MTETAKRFCGRIVTRRALAAIAALLMACRDSPSSPRVAQSVGASYVSAMIDLMQAHSINRKKIDWTSFRAQVLAAVPSGAGISDSYTAIFLALELLGDNHSFYSFAGGAVLQASTLDCSAPTISTVASPWPDVGYVRVPSFEGTAGAAQLFTDALQASIRAADTAHLREWIVDLRGNGGGNMYPMVAGIGPILGTGIAGYFIDPAGKTDSWGYDGKEAQTDGEVVQAASAPYSLFAPAPAVAVLIDRRVASAGEAVAVAFKQRPNTRFFGTATCGLSTANMGYSLSDGAVLVLTEAVMADRTSTVYGGPLQPDELIADTAALVPTAVAWLRANAIASGATSASISGLRARSSGAGSPASRRRK
jgi:carboxyl-terminal processing protease